MNKLLPILIFCCFIKELKSQTWCPSGATWHYRVLDTRPLQGQDGTLEMKFTNTVVVNGITCKQIIGTFYGYVYWNPSPTGTVTMSNFRTIITYESNRVVYVYNANYQTFDTLANFNAAPGDSWFYPGVSQSCSALQIPRYKYTVYDTGHVVINGQSLKTLNFISNYQNGYVEKLGGVSGFLFSNQVCVMDGESYNGRFSCYSDANFPVFMKPGVSNCFYNTVGLDSPTLDAQSFKIFPNPNSGFFELVIPEPAQLKIFNALGEMVMETNYTKAGQFSQDLASLPDGLYYLLLKTSKKTLETKLVKN